MRILVTGAGGRLGGLLRAAHSTFGNAATDVLFQSRKPGADVTWTPDEPVTSLPDCDALVALWGQTSGDESTLQQNVTLVDLTRDVARASGAQRVFHMSSAAVYGPGAAMAEDHPLAPLGAYGQSKLEMERKIAASRSADFDECCLRVANVVGADSLAPGLTGDGPVCLDRFEDGHGPLRSYVSARDLLALVNSLSQIETPPPLRLNIAAPKPVAMQALVEAAGKEIRWRPAPASAVQEVTLDVTCMTRLLPDTRVTSDAREMIADWRDLEGTE